MTNGTSQGLFVVVAIVIFGIFVGLAYTAFGKEGLSNDLKSIFENATEQAHKDLRVSLIDFESFTAWNKGRIKEESGKIIMESNSTSGMYLSKDYFEPNKNYELSFNYEVLSGTVDYIGGHFSLSDDILVYVDGKLINSSWFDPKNTPFPQEKGKHNVKVVFNTNLYDNPRDSYGGTAVPDMNFYVQPNRFFYEKLYVLELSRLKLIEV